MFLRAWHIEPGRRSLREYFAALTFDPGSIQPFSAHRMRWPAAQTAFDAPNQQQKTPKRNCSHYVSRFVGHLAGPVIFVMSRIGRRLVHPAEKNHPAALRDRPR